MTSTVVVAVPDSTHSNPLEEIEKRCRTCGGPFLGYAAVPTQRECPKCLDAAYSRILTQELGTWKAEAIARLDQSTLLKLQECGLSTVEQRADEKLVPKEIREMLPRLMTRAMVTGADIAKVSELHGFGLIGGAGVGKTMCFASIMRQRTRAILADCIEKRTQPPQGDDDAAWHAAASFIWWTWPDRAAWLKAVVMSKTGAATVETFTQRAITTPLLIIDDLGRERLAKGGYDEDYAVGVLDRVLDGRSRARAFTYWTSNLTREGIASRYGAAMTSRLLGMAPSVELPKLQDLRLSGV